MREGHRARCVQLQAILVKIVRGSTILQQRFPRQKTFHDGFRNNKMAQECMTLGPLKHYVPGAEVPRGLRLGS